MAFQRSWIVAAGGLAALVADAHIYIEESRQCYNSGAYQTEDYPNYEPYAGAYNAGNQVEVQKRAIALTDPALLAEYGDGWWPLRWVYEKGEMATNGNYVEPQGISVRHGVCGDPKSTDQGGKDGDAPKYSTPNKDWPILQEFTKGGIIDITAVMKAHHWGHLEFFICDAADLADPDGVATQECFNKHPLTRAEGDDVNSPIDPNYPGRYYADPPCRKEELEQTFDWRCGGGYQMNMKYQLPADLECEHCILQMWYFTGHRCKHPGYDEFNPPSWPSQCAPNKSDWIDVDLPFCGSESWLVCEEFWNCSDIRVKSDGSTPPPPPEATPEPTPEATAEPTPEPTSAPVVETPTPTAKKPEPTAEPTPEPTSEPTPEPNPEPTPCSGAPVEAYEQCGGRDWTGSTCCLDGYECTKMGTLGCYSQCRPRSV